MGTVAFACALAGLAALAVAGLGKYVAIGLGIFALGAGWIGWREGRRAGRRLLGAAGMVLGLVAAGLGGAEVALTLAFLSRLLKLAA